MPRYQVTATRVRGHPGKELDLGEYDAQSEGEAIGMAKARCHEQLGLYLTESGWRPCNQRYKARIVP